MPKDVKSVEIKRKKGFMNPARRVILWVLGILFIVGFAYFLFIKFTGLSLTCFYYENFGIKCPGCGLTRMFMALLRLDFASAFAFNPYMFCTLFVWIAITLSVFVGKPKFASKPWFLYSLALATFLGSVIFAILRNL